MDKKKILSCFIDESGDFGKVDNHSPFYYVAMVFHEQENDISTKIEVLDNQIKNWGYPFHAIHTGPLIRREGFYINDERENRRALFNALYHFARKLEISYICAKIDKRKIGTVGDVAMANAISKVIMQSLRKHLEYLQKFEEIVVYYDNGQQKLTELKQEKKKYEGLIYQTEKMIEEL